MGTFLKYVLLIMGIYFIFKAIVRGIVAYLAGETNAKNLNNHKMRRQQEEMRQRQKKQEGRITIKYQPPKTPKNIGKNLGDYVDFEEIK